MAKFNEETIQKCVDWVCENGLIDSVSYTHLTLPTSDLV